ncbi:MAG: DUF1538 domain-containing protein, partial [Rhodospirillaceae bacterium]|nr:DUF1538 domain-containing protein [Rhodospirillaceae bacterium]
MERKFRYGDFVREVTINQKSLSYENLTPKPKYDEQGNQIPYVPPPLKPNAKDVYRLLTPYVGIRLADQLKAVVPLAAYLVLFQVIILRQHISDSWILTGGMIAVIIGLMLFMEGLKLGLMPFAESIGNKLPKKSSLRFVLFISFLLGIGVTLAEPAIGALQAVGSIVSVERAPYLYEILNNRSGTLVLCVGIGVGLAAVVGTLRFLYGWSLKPLIYMTLMPTLGLTIYIMRDPELAKVLGLAWDSGAVTTGPVTVPLVLALGIGITSAAGKGTTSLSGFGIVTLASLFPIISVMLLSLYVASTTDSASIIAAATSGPSLAMAKSWVELTPVQEIIAGLRAIVPLVLFLMAIMTYVLKDKIANAGIVNYGLALCLGGMIIFNIGLSYGLANLGGQSGGLVPAAFASVSGVDNSPLFEFSTGVAVAIFFAWALGFGATLAEPALNALGMTVENLTNGAFKKKLLMYSVSLGVGFGIAIGVFKIIFVIPIAYLL